VTRWLWLAVVVTLGVIVFIGSRTLLPQGPSAAGGNDGARIVLTNANSLSGTPPGSGANRQLTPRQCVSAWNVPQNAHARAVLRQDGTRTAYVSRSVGPLTETLGDGSSVKPPGCEVIGAGTRAVMFFGGLPFGGVSRWLGPFRMPEAAIPRASDRQFATARVLPDGRLKLL
jgi:hypothetical protein